MNQKLITATSYILVVLILINVAHIVYSAYVGTFSPDNYLTQVLGITILVVLWAWNSRRNTLHIEK